MEEMCSLFLQGVCIISQVYLSCHFFLLIKGQIQGQVKCPCLVFVQFKGKL